MLKKTCLLLLSIYVLVHSLLAQTPNGPGEYMTAISSAYGDMNQKYMAYVSAAAHGRRARKVEKLRQQALASIDASRDKTIMLPLYKGDNSLRQASIDYIKLCYNIFSEDYGKIVNLEEIAEQSIDQMEAYLLLQEKTSEKLKQANEKIHKASVEFAAKYNVTLVEAQKDELSEKLEKAGRLNHYMNEVFLVFFKCNFQEGQVTKFMNENKVGDIEQARNALLRYADEGLTKLETLKSFDGDPSLAAACRNFLNFCKTNATSNLPKQLDYYVKKDNFEKLKKAMDAKGSPTKEEIDSFNAAVKEINNGINQFNQLNNKMNGERNAVYTAWESAQKAFADTHMPYYK